MLMVVFVVMTASTGFSAKITGERAMNGKNGKTAGRLTAVALAAMLGVSLGMVRPVQAAETDWRAGNTLVAHKFIVPIYKRISEGNFCPYFFESEILPEPDTSSAGRVLSEGVYSSSSPSNRS